MRAKAPIGQKHAPIAGGRTQKQTGITDGPTWTDKQAKPEREREREKEEERGGRSTVKCTSRIQQTGGVWGKGWVQAPAGEKWAAKEPTETRQDGERPFVSDGLLFPENSGVTESLLLRSPVIS